MDTIYIANLRHNQAMSRNDVVFFPLTLLGILPCHLEFIGCVRPPDELNANGRENFGYVLFS